MPVALTILDGPAATPWLSEAVMPVTVTQMGGTLSLTRVTGTLRRADRYGVAITVENTGSEAAEPLAKLRTGSFDSAKIETTSATSSMTIDIANSVTEPLVLKNAGGNVLAQWPEFGGSRSGAYGWSTDGRWLFIVHRTNPTTDWTVEIVACVLTGAIAPGTRVFVEPVSTGSGAFTFASSGWGFAPDNSDVLCIVATDSVGVPSLILYDLRRSRQSQPYVLLKQQLPSATYGAWRISPGGDLAVAYGTAKLDFWEADASGQGSGRTLTPAVNGISIFIRPAPGVTPTFAISRAEGGYGAITLTNVKDNNGQPVAAIDAPQSLRCAVEVHGWVCYVGTMLTVQGGQHLPGFEAGDGHPASAFIARIGAKVVGAAAPTELALINANWNPGTANTVSKHWCVVGEAYTTPETLPADLKRRTSTTDFQILRQNQTAHRNLTVI